jgi:hypothetical protein
MPRVYCWLAGSGVRAESTWLVFEWLVFEGGHAMRTTSWRWLWLLAVSLGFAGRAAGEGGAPERLDVRTVRAVVFKDGYCLLAKKATGRFAGRVYVDDVPKMMVLGSFWAVPKKGKLLSITSTQQIIPKQGRTETERRMILEFDPAAKGADGQVEVDLFYYTPGLRWIPTYQIALGEDGTAALAMQGEILNEAEDLPAVPVDLVVGVPNFRFRKVVSPLSLEPTLQDPLVRAAPEIMDQSTSNQMFSQRAGEFRGRRAEEAPAAPGGAPAMPPELAAEGAQDLFVYHIPTLSLRAGERAAIPVLNAQVPFRHLYTWNVLLTRSGAEEVPGGGRHASPIRLLKNDVWHQIELTNNTQVPWTTGAALTMQGYLPIGQELLTYTSVGGKCQVPLTVAVDVRGTCEEAEISRKPNAVNYQGNPYALITKKGTLRVTNSKKTAVTLYLTCDLGGNASEASDDGKITITDYQNADWQNVQGHPALTGHSTICWELVVEPGKTREVTCQYAYYLRM